MNFSNEIASLCNDYHLSLLELSKITGISLSKLEDWIKNIDVPADELKDEVITDLYCKVKDYKYTYDEDFSNLMLSQISFSTDNLLKELKAFLFKINNANTLDPDMKLLVTITKEGEYVGFQAIEYMIKHQSNLDFDDSNLTSFVTRFNDFYISVFNK